VLLARGQSGDAQSGGAQGAQQLLHSRRS
jgi:hypothetical protein